MKIRFDLLFGFKESGVLSDLNSVNSWEYFRNSWTCMSFSYSQQNLLKSPIGYMPKWLPKVNWKLPCIARARLRTQVLQGQVIRACIFAPYFPNGDTLFITQTRTVTAPHASNMQYLRWSFIEYSSYFWRAYFFGIHSRRHIHASESQKLPNNL